MNAPLSPLLAPIADLPGIAPLAADRIAHVARGPRVLDLLFHMPETYIDRRARPTIATALPGAIATLAVEVTGVATPERGTNQPWRVTITDGTGFAEIAYFRIPPPPAVKPGRKLMLSGRIETFGDRKQVRSPRLVDLERGADLPPIEPVWPLTARLKQPDVERAMTHALARLPGLAEWHDPALLRREAWPGFTEALRTVQAPQALPVDAARARLAYDELFAHQLAITWSRTRTRARPGRATAGDGVCAPRPCAASATS